METVRFVNCDRAEVNKTLPSVSTIDAIISLFYYKFAIHNVNIIIMTGRAHRRANLMSLMPVLHNTHVVNGWIFTYCIILFP